MSAENAMPDENVAERLAAKSTALCGVKRWVKRLYDFIHRHGRVLLTVSLVCFVYAYGVNVRMEEWPKWQNSGLQVDGAYLLPTNDAYFDMTAADGDRAKQPGTLLSWMVAVGHALTGQPHTNVGLFVPVIFSPLAALPLVLLLCWWRLYAGALAAGVFLLSTPGYLARTRLGFCDTDIYTLLLPVALASLFAVWSTTRLPLPQRERGFFGLGLRRKPESDAVLTASGAVPDAAQTVSLGDKAGFGVVTPWRRDVARFMILAFGCGLLAWLYPQIYTSGRVIVMATLMAGMGGLVLSQRRQLLWAAVGCAVVGLTFYNPLWGLGGLALALGLMFVPHIRTIFEAIPPLFLYAVAFVGLLVLLGHFYPQIRGAMASYATIETPIGEDKVVDGVNVPNTYATISEVQRPYAGTLYAFINPQRIVYWTALAGLVLGLARFPALFSFMPLVCLFFGALFWGARFSMYGAGLAVFFGLSVSVLEPSYRAMPWARLQGLWRKCWRGLRVAFSWGLSLTACWVLSQTTYTLMKDLGPGAVLSVAHARHLQALDKVVEPGASLWMWWDFGLAAQYYAHRDTVADGHFNSFNSIYLPGFVLSTNSSMQANRVMAFYAAHSIAMPPVPTAPEHVRYYSQAMAKLLDMGHEKAMAFLESLKNASLPPEALPASSSEKPLIVPPQYVAVTWEGLQHVYHMSKIGKWNLRQGGSPTYRLIRQENITDYSQAEGVFTFNKAVNMSLDGMAVRDADGTVTHIRTGLDTNLYAILNTETHEMYVMHRDMFNATYVRLLMWDARTPPVEGFRMVYDDKGSFRAFKAEFDAITPAATPSTAKVRP